MKLLRNCQWCHVKWRLRFVMDAFCISITGELNSRTSRPQRCLLPVIWDPTERSNTLWETTQRARHPIEEKFCYKTKSVYILQTKWKESDSFRHRVYRVLCPIVRSGSPTPSPASVCPPPPPLDPRGETLSLAEEAVGRVPNCDEGTGTLVLYVYYCTCIIHLRYSATKAHELLCSRFLILRSIVKSNKLASR
jgi:hypothetical protein